jgi:hypothetical protein
MAASNSIFVKDDTHPIPDLEVCDVHGVRKDGGHDFVIVIASPLDADERSQRRLLEKIGRYLECLSGLGSASTSARSRIMVKIHASSDPAIFELLRRSRAWIEDNQVSLEVATLPGANNIATTST